VSAVLPLKDSSRELIIEVTRALEPYFPDITAKWREKIAQEFDFDGRILVALEQLQLAAACTFICGKNDFKGLVESLSYHGSRLAKLQVDTRAVARSFELYLNVCEPYVGSLFGERRAELMATLEAFSSACFVVVSGAYFDAKSEQNAALLSILDAELSAADLPSVFEQVLKITAKVFGASVGVLMLKEMGSNRLQARAKLGFSFTSPPRITKPSIELPERSAPAKFVPISQAPFRLARASFAPWRLEDTSRAANRFAPERSARLKSSLLSSRSERSLPAKSIRVAGSAFASISRT